MNLRGLLRKSRLALLTLCCAAASNPVPAASSRDDALTSQQALGVARTPAEVLLVYNADSPISTAVAKYYSVRRGVTKMVAVHCADAAVSQANETIRLGAYQRSIAEPVSRYLARDPGIHFIVLTKGMPLRVRGGITGSRWVYLPRPLDASLDSYLAAIDYPLLTDAKKIRITGSGATGYGWLNRYWKAKAPFTHAAFGGYLVTRLDGYTQQDAEALVDRSIASEKPNGSRGGDSASHSPASEAAFQAKVLLDVQPAFGIDDIASQPLDVIGPVPDESPYGSWNADMVKAAGILSARGIPFDLDKSDTFAGNAAHLLGYFSWGSNDPKFLESTYHSLRFAPGSIGDTAVSTSARTFLPTTGGQSLIADLIAQGITGVKGYTDEPLLQAIASPSILVDRLSSGFTLAESFYAASRFVGWEDVVVGDPLCRPAAWIGNR